MHSISTSLGNDVSFVGLPKHLPTRLRHFRKEHGVSVRIFCESFGFSYDSWMHQERKLAPYASSLRHLRNATGIDFNKLFRDEKTADNLLVESNFVSMATDVNNVLSAVGRGDLELLRKRLVSALMMLPPQAQGNEFFNGITYGAARSGSRLGALLNRDEYPRSSLTPGERFKFLREYCGLSQVGMARVIDSSITRVRQWENMDCNPRGDVFFAFADFSVDLNWLVAGDGNLFCKSSAESERKLLDVIAHQICNTPLDCGVVHEDSLRRHNLIITGLKKNKISMTQLAKSHGFSCAALSRVAKGSLRSPVVEEILAKAIGMPVNELWSDRSARRL